MKELKSINNKEKDTKLMGKVKDSKFEYEKKKMNAVNKVFKIDKHDYNPINRITKTHSKLEEIANHMVKNKLTPSVIFVFSIKKIDEYAMFLSSTNDFTTGTEKNKILKFFDKCMSVLCDEDKQIRQIGKMRLILQNGIGMHHAGLLPILKETIEVLYSKGLIKILFATTSFSIGLNMPTRTVAFSDIMKYNDEQKEILSSVIR